jgi:hypothetical protein
MSEHHTEHHSDDHKEKYNTFFEPTTVGIGFVVTALLLGVIAYIFIFG